MIFTVSFSRRPCNPRKPHKLYIIWKRQSTLLHHTHTEIRELERDAESAREGF